MKKFYKGLLACISTFSLVMCTKWGGSSTEYTYREAIGATPAEWNPHILSDNFSSFVDSLTTIGFVQIGMKEDKGHQWTLEMATSITDITESYPNKAKYKIPNDATSDRVFEIKLNENACWEDGTPINADTYIYSMKQLLDSDMKNPQSVKYTDDKLAIANAKDYFYNGKDEYIYMSGYVDVHTAEDLYYTDDDNCPIYYNLDEKIPNFQLSISDIHDQYGFAFILNDNDLYDELDIGEGNHQASEATKEVLEIVASRLFEDASLWTNFCTYKYHYAANWEDVGFYKVDDYTVVYVTKLATTREDLISYFHSAKFLVYEDLYEAGKTTVGDLKTTNYGTSPATYMSYGPYKLVSMETNKQIVLVKNDKWYGYRDAKHIGQYQTTKVIGEVIPTHEGALQAFLKGELEAIDLTTEDLKKYGYSDYLLKSEEDFVYSFSFNNKLEQLEALETAAGDGSNKKICSYRKFKEAFSYSINRLRFVNETTTGGTVQFGLFNKNYYYDIKNDTSSVYRNSEYGMKSIVNHYGVEYGSDKEYKTLKEAYRSITGYDLEKARTLFQELYLQMKEDGTYNDELVKLNCLCTEKSEVDESKIQQRNIINTFLSDATVGTGFAGKITVTFSRSDNNVKDFRDGRCEMIFGVKYGQVFNPYTQIRKYIDGGSFTVGELACYDPSTETLDITINNVVVTKTILNWSKAIENGGVYYNSGNDIKLTILSQLEQYLIDQYINVPVFSRGTAKLSSKKVIQGNTEYNLYYGFGGIRHLTYKYSDKGWNNYVKRNGGTIKYE